MFYEIVLDHGETANKCTIAPLAYRSDFRILRVKADHAIGPLTASVLLHHEGVCISTVKSAAAEIKGIAAIDCIWRRLDPLLRRLAGETPVFTKIPDGFVSAYPRKSKFDYDPDGGLATIEAIFVANALLGKWDISLLGEYYFGLRFLEINAKRFSDFGISHIAQDILNYPPLQLTRTAWKRRIGRGRVTVTH